MRFSRRAKQLIAGTAGLMFLLCYSAGVAQGCSTVQHAPEKSEMPPCHQMMADKPEAPAQVTSPKCHDIDACQADPSSPDWNKTFVVAVVDIFTTPDSAVAPFQPPSLRVKPPPLRLLHCCLRN